MPEKKSKSFYWHVQACCVTIATPPSFTPALTFISNQTQSVSLLSSSTLWGGGLPNYKVVMSGSCGFSFTQMKTPHQMIRKRLANLFVQCLHLFLTREIAYLYLFIYYMYLCTNTGLHKYMNLFVHFSSKRVVLYVHLFHSFQFHFLAQ